MTNARLNQLEVRDYCSEILSELPCGIIEKSHTGMGATHLELHSKRNSIIVEPVRITAKAKADSINDHPDYRSIYIGGELETDKPTFSPMELELFLEIEGGYHKIVCVADSFPKTYEILKRKNIVGDYFLLIDEIDSFQMDSSFRYSMENCLDIYLEFPEDKRAMLTATPIEFTDKRLHNEDRTLIRKKEAILQSIEVNPTTHPFELVVEKIISIILSPSTSNDQIVVAINSIKLILGIIKTLETHLNTEYLTQNPISIMCGVNSKSKAGGYFKTLQNNEYPSKITFITSAYFTGYDIEKPYHLISAASVKIEHSLLSADQVKQISGRLRKHTLLSNTLIIEQYQESDDVSKDTYTQFQNISQSKLMYTGETLIRAHQCMENNFKDDPDTFGIYNAFLEGCIEKLQKNHLALIRKKYNSNNHVISSFFIDSKIAQKNNFFALYFKLTAEKLTNLFLDKGFDAKLETLNIPNLVLEEYDDDLISKLEKQSLMDWLQNLKSNESDILLEGLTSTNKELQLPNIDRLKKLFLKNQPQISAPRFIALVFEHLVRKKDGEYLFAFKDRRAFETFTLRLSFLQMKDSDGFILLLKNRFPNGIVLTKSEIDKRLKDCLNQSNLSIATPLFQGPKRAMELLNILFQTSYTKRKETGAERVVKIVQMKPRMKS